LLSFDQENQIIEKEEGIDFKKLFNFFIRNKIIITPITIFTLFLSGLYILIGEKSWVGELQIVLKKELNLNQNAEDLANLNILNLSGMDTGLMTEVEILKSPSVLRPIFEFVKKEKLLRDNKFRKWKYTEWLKDNLEVNLETGTSVLNIKYNDENKDLIIPVLEKISNAYQIYSTDKKTKNLKNTIDYLDKQISIFDAKSINSLTKLQKFAVENKIDNSIFRSRYLINESETITNENYFIEQNEIKRLEERIKRIKLMNYGDDELIYMAEEIAEEEDQLLIELNLFEEKIARARATFKEDSKQIQELLERKSFLVKALEEKIIGILNGQREILISDQIANSRPTDVILKYKTLFRQSARDELTLNQLENKKLFMLLENAKKENPWKLITEPSIFDKPTKPKKSLSLFFGLFSGILSGVFISTILEKKKNLIYEIDDFKLLINLESIIDLKSLNQSDSCEFLNLLANSSLNKEENDDISILTSSNIDKDIFDKFYNQFSKSLNSRKSIIINNVSQAKNYRCLIFVTSLGSITKNELLKLEKKLYIQNNKLSFLILL
tara:strand:- start:32291 stop:33955 length:1665 start_codon:yes stop_codon:yes gene_type:complete